MLHSLLDPRVLRAEFQRAGRLQVRPVLQDRAARLLLDCLAHEVPWTLAYREGGCSRTMPREDYAGMDEQARRQLIARAQETSKGQYGFAYESYMMVKAYIEKIDPGLMLHTVLEYLNSEEFLNFARAATGLDRVRRVNAQATRYRAGHFLRQHSDQDDEEGRLVAYVINLTPGWSADCGGLLQFVGADGSVEDTFFPHWNSMSLFRVPQEHLVSVVAPYAQEDRLAITGWFLS